MPLVHKKTPAAFKRNIEIEMEHGKPQKQAVAIAYHVKDEAQHHKMAAGGCVGPECRGCASANCYAEGGSIDSPTKRSNHEVGINRSSLRSPGTSEAGSTLHPAFSFNKDIEGHAAKREHKNTLHEMKSMKKPNLYAEGGSVNSWTKREDHERGVHRELTRKGESRMGSHVREAGLEHNEEDKKESMEAAKHKSRQSWIEAKSMKKPNLYAEGGEVHDDVPEPDKKNAAAMQKGAMSGEVSPSEGWSNLREGLGLAHGGEVSEGEDQFAEPEHEGDDHEISGMLGDELMSAFESKDKKRIMESIEAIVLSCMNKE